MATVTPEQAGKYRQLAPTLRIAVPGKGEREQSRPRRNGSDNGPFVDSDTEPTVIELEAGDPVDVPWLLAVGAIAPLPPASAPEPIVP